MCVPAPSIRVLCVDDHRIVRDGIALIVAREADMEVVGSASTGEDAVALFRQHRPDITLMDLRLPRMSGLEAIRAIRMTDPDARLVVLTMHQGDEDIHKAITAGAAAYLLKDTLPDDLIRVIREVHSGGHPTNPEVLRRLAAHDALPSLTPRELEVLELISQGLRSKEIAMELGISEETVPVHIRHIFSKLGVNDRTAAVTVALRRGILHIDS